ncbi:carboxyl-terminal hydrolase [Anaeramoeba flamelloides]|uniref:Carboxyl-terminal hydrolase n=1 Tax=Anaeramoeba flamelloides TaxID=1746091 RepID=A0ABQ8Y295_9EUKA|nr:carboxyl-terminal hydrolase [Anaeramoeba flamelloides]
MTNQFASPNQETNKKKKKNNFTLSQKKQNEKKPNYSKKEENEFNEQRIGSEFGGLLRQESFTSFSDWTLSASSSEIENESDLNSHGIESKIKGTKKKEIVNSNSEGGFIIKIPNKKKKKKKKQISNEKEKKIDLKNLLNTDSSNNQSKTIKKQNHKYKEKLKHLENEWIPFSENETTLSSDKEESYDSTNWIDDQDIFHEKKKRNGKRSVFSQNLFKLTEQQILNKGSYNRSTLKIENKTTVQKNDSRKEINQKFFVPEKNKIAKNHNNGNKENKQSLVIFTKTIQQPYPTSLQTIEHFHQIPFSSGIKGLKDLGNTSYLNSLLQCLNEIYELRDFLLKRPKRIKEGKLIKSLRIYYFNMWKSNYWNQIYAPKVILKGILKVYPKFYKPNTKDPYLLFVDLISQLITEEKQRLKNKLKMNYKSHLNLNYDHLETILEKMFCGKIKTKIKCENCKNIHKNTESFNYLNLDFKKIINNKKKKVILKFEKEKRKKRKSIEMEKRDTNYINIGNIGESNLIEIEVNSKNVVKPQIIQINQQKKKKKKKKKTKNTLNKLFSFLPCSVCKGKHETKKKKNKNKNKKGIDIDNKNNNSDGNNNNNLNDNINSNSTTDNENSVLLNTFNQTDIKLDQKSIDKQLIFTSEKNELNRINQKTNIVLKAINYYLLKKRNKNQNNFVCNYCKKHNEHRNLNNSQLNSDNKNKIFFSYIPRILIIVFKKNNRMKKGNNNRSFPFKFGFSKFYFSKYDNNNNNTYFLSSIITCKMINNKAKYVTYSKKSDSCWYYCLDSQVKKITKEKIKKLHPYMLFYRKNQFDNKWKYLK